MNSRTPGIAIAIALVLVAVACKRRDQVAATPTPVTVPTLAPPAMPDVPVQPLAAPVTVDAGPVVPGPNAMAQPGTGVPPSAAAPPPAAAPGTIAPGAAPPTGAPPAAPIAAAPSAPASPTAGSAPSNPTARPPTNTNRPTEIRLPGVTNQPPINIDQHNGQTRVNVGGVQIVIPGANR